MLFVCPACGGEKSGELHSTEKRGVLLRYQKCAHCKSVFRKDFGLEDEKLLYGYQAGWSQLTKDEAYPEVNAQRYRLLLKRLDAQANGRCLLDVGCGKGHFVYRAQEAGWDAWGIEITPSAVQTAQRLGAPVSNQDFHNIGNRVFDVISMFELVEHLVDPVSYISKAATLLQPGGLLYITTPNVQSLDAKIAQSSWRAFDPEHLVLFSPEQLARVVESCGFEIEQVTTRNLSPSLLKRALRERLGPKSRGRSHAVKVDSSRKSDQRLRHRLRGSSSASFMLDVANAVVGKTGAGEYDSVVGKKGRRPEAGLSIR